MTAYRDDIYYNHLTSDNAIRSTARRIVKYYPKLLFRLLDRTECGMILDIGCGTGQTLDKIKMHFKDRFSYHGTDIRQSSRLPGYIKFSKGDALDLPYASRVFDAVILSNLLEHTYDPYKATDEAFRVLKPGGRIYVETPSVKAVFNPFSLNFYDDPSHVRPYTKSSLKQIMEECGFVDVIVQTKRTYIVILLGFIYLIPGLIFRDHQARTLFFNNLFGLNISAVGERQPAQ